MRRLARNEQRLLILFGAAVFVALNLFAVRAWMQHRAALVSKISQTRAAIATGQSWISAAGALADADQWMEQNPPPSSSGEKASTDLLNTVRALAEKSDLKLVEETLLPNESAPTGDSAILQAKLTGPFAGVARLLFELQTPTAWRAVDKMAIRSDNEPPNVIVDLVVRQYYRAPSPAAPVPGT
jgi:hypothetical protein